MYDAIGSSFRFGPGSLHWALTFLGAEDVHGMLRSVTRDADEWEKEDTYGTAGGGNGGLFQEFNAPLALHPYDCAYWSSFCPPGADPATAPVPAWQEDGRVDLAKNDDGSPRLLSYVISPRVFGNVRALFASWLPKHAPTGTGLHSEVQDRVTLPFLEDTITTRGVNRLPVWCPLKEQVLKEKRAWPLPGREMREPDGARARGAPKVAQRRVGGEWSCVWPPGTEADWTFAPATRTWRLSHGGDDYELVERSFTASPGFKPLVELRVHVGTEVRQYRLIQVGAVRRFESEAEADLRRKTRWLRVYFAACWDKHQLMSASLQRSIDVFEKEAEQAGTDNPFPGDRGEGWGQGEYDNLGSQMNLFVNLLELAECTLQINTNHHAFVKCYMSALGTGRADFGKPPHMLWVGGASAGKSFLAECVSKCVPGPVWMNSSHTSAQCRYTHAPCTDTNTGQIIEYHDEAHAGKLGMERKAKTMVNADNAMDERGAEYRNQLTMRVTASAVLLSNKETGIREQVIFQADNSNVQWHCMNTYFDLSPAMLSRFIRQYFVHMKRVDRDLLAAGERAEEVTAHLENNVCKHMRLLYYRSMMLFMAQYVGIISRPAVTGWNLFKTRFKQVMAAYYQGVVGTDYLRVMDDAQTLMICFVNFHAVYRVWAHHGSPFRNNRQFSFAMLLECEKHLVPCDNLFEVVMTWMEESFFSTSERQVGGRAGGVPGACRPLTPCWGRAAP